MYRKTPEDESEWSPADWAVEGLRFIIDRDFEHGSYYRRGIGHILTAISLDVQRDNRRRAYSLADIARPLIENIELLLGNESAVDYYETAEPYFDDTDWEDRTWRFEPEFETIGVAMRWFFESKGYDFPFTQYPHSERLTREIELTEKILNQNE